MRLLQLYYTSFNRKHSAGKRQQIFSSSEGFSDGELKELERICLYKPPNHLPTQQFALKLMRISLLNLPHFSYRAGATAFAKRYIVEKTCRENTGIIFLTSLCWKKELGQSHRFNFTVLHYFEKNYQ